VIAGRIASGDGVAVWLAANRLAASTARLSPRGLLLRGLGHLHGPLLGCGGPLRAAATASVRISA
jgi:hypothetical protein